MTRPVLRLRSAFAAAFLALGLLAFAQVRSAAMQAAEPAGLDCGMSPAAMADMGGMGPHEDGRAPKAAPHAACPFCAAAAHVAPPAFAPDLPPPVVVAWTPAPAARTPPARGSPAPQPRARGPPASPLTA